MLCLALSACGSTYRSTGVHAGVVGGHTVAIKATSSDADPGIRNAITSELARRNLQVTTGPGRPDYVLSYYDEWKWDIVMYLWALNLEIAESGTGKILATGDFGHFGIHHYPDNRAVVREIFEKMDRQGVFAASRPAGSRRE